MNGLMKLASTEGSFWLRLCGMVCDNSPERNCKVQHGLLACKLCQDL